MGRVIGIGGVLRARDPFRVSDLDAMVKRLRAAGVDVRPQGREYPNGRFAERTDLADNPIQLCEPNAPSLARDPASAKR